MKNNLAFFTAGEFANIHQIKEPCTTMIVLVFFLQNIKEITDIVITPMNKVLNLKTS